MIARGLVNEFAKMRHRGVGLVASVLVVIVVGLSVFSAVTSPEFASSSPSGWNALLAGMSLAVPLASPLLLAVLASRQVDVEHEGNGWLLSQTSGVTAGGLCRVKFLAIGVIIATATFLTSMLVACAGLLLGLSAPLPAQLWIGYTISILVTNLVVLALHIVLAARIDNQLVGLGVGVVGTVGAVFATALPATLAHVTPWGYYALATAAGYQDGGLVALTPSYPSIAMLGVVSATLFVLVTGQFDRQEA